MLGFDYQALSLFFQTVDLNPQRRRAALTRIKRLGREQTFHRQVENVSHDCKNHCRFGNSHQGSARPTRRQKMPNLVFLRAFGEAFIDNGLVSGDYGNVPMA
jgi:hypothetical protein